MLGASFTLDDAEDVAQDAFVELYRQAPRYRYPEPVRPWLYKIAVNKCFDRLRMLQRRPMPGRLHDDDVAVDGPLSSIEADERECRINNAIDGLPPKLKAVFVLRFVDDLAYDEIAKVLKVPIGTVKTWLFRARAALRVQLQEARDNDL
jgi:RNA polymerase sigma-70 factor (ECF subfamily)